MERAREAFDESGGKFIARWWEIFLKFSASNLRRKSFERDFAQPAQKYDHISIISLPKNFSHQPPQSTSSLFLLPTVMALGENLPFHHHHHHHRFSCSLPVRQKVDGKKA
jgi:hypothetical protein